MFWNVWLLPSISVLSQVSELINNILGDLVSWCTISVLLKLNILSGQMMSLFNYFSKHFNKWVDGNIFSYNDVVVLDALLLIFYTKVVEGQWGLCHMQLSFIEVTLSSKWSSVRWIITKDYCQYSQLSLIWGNNSMLFPVLINNR